MMKYKALSGITVLAVFFLFLCSCYNGKRVELIVDEQNNNVEVLVDGELFTAYIYPEQVKKPVLWPVMSPKGNMLTRSYPMVNKEGDRTDHPHHVGVWFNYGDVNGLDFWNNSEAIPEENRHEYGSIRHISVEKAEGGMGMAELVTRSEWLTPDGKALLKEKSTFKFQANEGLRIIDRSSILEAVADTVLFRDNKEGMFAIRVARELELPSQGATKLVDAHGNITEVEQSDNSLVRGNYRNADGIEGGEVWGTRCRWMKLFSEINGEVVSLVIIDHPSNPGYATYWHARGYGLFSANTLGQRVFSKGEHELDYQLTKGESAEFKYRLVVASGDLSDEMINQLADSYSAAGE
jgi:hypothetical protein